jgi:hypothetical protein
MDITTICAKIAHLGLFLRLHLFITTSQAQHIEHLVLFHSKTLRRPRALSNSIVVKFRELVQRLLHSGQLLCSLAFHSSSHLSTDEQANKQKSHVRRGPGLTHSTINIIRVGSAVHLHAHLAA